MRWHPDRLTEVQAGSINVVGGNVSGSVKQRTIPLDSSGFVAPATSGCRYFAILKPPRRTVATGAGVLDTIESLPGRIAAAMRAGATAAQAGMAIAGGERDAGRLTNIVFYGRHPELPPAYKIQPKDKQLATEWLRIRDGVIRPLLNNL